MLLCLHISLLDQILYLHMFIFILAPKGQFLNIETKRQILPKCCSD